MGLGPFAGRSIPFDGRSLRYCDGSVLIDGWRKKLVCSLTCESGDPTTTYYYVIGCLESGITTMLVPSLPHTISGKGSLSGSLPFLLPRSLPGRHTFREAYPPFQKWRFGFRILSRNGGSDSGSQSATPIPEMAVRIQDHTNPQPPFLVLCGRKNYHGPEFVVPTWWFPINTSGL
jgi:hypothetical protein